MENKKKIDILNKLKETNQIEPEERDKFKSIIEKQEEEIHSYKSIALNNMKFL